MCSQGASDGRRVLSLRRVSHAQSSQVFVTPCRAQGLGLRFSRVRLGPKASVKPQSPCRLQSLKARNASKPERPPKQTQAEAFWESRE